MPRTTPPPLSPDRDPADNWVTAPTGERYWGTNGAAGLLVVAEDGSVLVQHRAEWSHFGGTWGLPGGARHTGEGAVAGALREAAEEAGVPPAHVVPVHVSVEDRGVWTYTTVVADVVEPFDPVAGDEESLELRWVAPAAIADLPLHPGFAAQWPTLRSVAQAPRPTVVVDGANVVGSVPDGWWRDRRRAADRLAERMSGWAAAGVSAADLGLPGAHWLPSVVLVLEGAGRGARASGVVAVDAPGSGDDEVVAQATHARGAVTVVTSDRDLRDRVAAVGATVRGPGWLLDQLA